MNAETNTAGIGHNSASVAETMKQDNETLAQRIADENKALKGRKDALLLRIADLPKVIKNDTQSGEISDAVKDLRSMEKEAEAIRVATKAPYLDSNDIVDSVFKKFKKPLQENITLLLARGTAYDEIVEEKKRKVLEAEAEKAREEEDRARAAAAKAAKGKSAEKAIDTAMDAGEARDKRVAAETKAETSAAELTRTRGEKSTSSLVTTWRGTIEDYDHIDLNKIRKYISRKAIDEAAERAAKDLEADGIGTIKGLRIFSEKHRRVS